MKKETDRAKESEVREYKICKCHKGAESCTGCELSTECESLEHYISKKELREKLKACLPEKKKPHTYSSENSDEYIKYCDAYNDAISQAEQNINKLSEEGREK